MHEPEMSSDGQWHFAAKADDVDEDEPALVVVGERQIALCRFVDTFYAIDNICSHEYACFTDGFLENGEIECPLHQARFCIQTGRALSAPAEVDVATFEVKHEGDSVYVKV